MTLEALERAKEIEEKMDYIKRIIESVSRILDHHDVFHPITMEFSLTYGSLASSFGKREISVRESREKDEYQGFIVHCLMNYKEMLEHELDELADELENL